MKKQLGILALVFSLLLATSAPAATTAAPATKPAPAAPAKVITLKFGHDNNTDGSYHAGALEFKRLVEEKTKGRVLIDVFPSAQLGNEVKLLESVRIGTVDFATCGCSNAATVFPELGLFSVSYLFKDQAHFDKCIAPGSAMIDRIKKLISNKKAGAQMGGLFTIGKRSVINKVKPIKSVNDLKGMKIRVMASPIETEVWTTFGAQPTTIPTPETYSALQTGVVTAAENAPIIIYSWKFHEPAPYYSLTEHQFFMSPVFVSDKTREKLPDDLEAIVMKCLEEASVYERKIDLEINDKALKDLAAAGCKINSDVDKQGFIGKLTSVQDKVAEQYKIQDVLKMIRDAK